MFFLPSLRWSCCHCFEMFSSIFKCLKLGSNLESKVMTLWNKPGRMCWTRFSRLSFSNALDSVLERLRDGSMYLAGGFNPFEKHESNWIISQVGVKIKHIWSHHLGILNTHTQKFIGRVHILHLLNQIPWMNCGSHSGSAKKTMTPKNKYTLSSNYIASELIIQLQVSYSILNDEKPNFYLQTKSIVCMKT